MREHSQSRTGTSSGQEHARRIKQWSSSEHTSHVLARPCTNGGREHSESVSGTFRKCVRNAPDSRPVRICLPTMSQRKSAQQLLCTQNSSCFLFWTAAMKSTNLQCDAQKVRTRPKSEAIPTDPGITKPMIFLSVVSFLGETTWITGLVWKNHT